MKVAKWVNGNFNKESDWVLITGGSSGIGLEYLKEFAKLGCNILSVCNQKEANIDISKRLSQRHGVEIEPIYVDLSSSTEVEQLLVQLQTYSVRALVNNAGFGIKNAFTKVDPTAYKQIIGVHVIAPTLLTHFFLSDMLKSNKGLIITVASINVASPIPGNTVYTATKTYQYNFALALAREYKDTNIVFQTLLPGTTDTPFHARQGAVPKSLVMKADTVVQRSLERVDQAVCIPNKIDRIGYPILSRLPMNMRMSMAKYLIKKRLEF